MSYLQVGGDVCVCLCIFQSVSWLIWYIKLIYISVCFVLDHLK